MSNQERTPLGLDTENQIDLEELTGALPRQKPTAQQQKDIYEAGEKSGFVSRQPMRRCRVSPYQAQFGGRCREGMKPLFQEIAERLNVHDTQALELAVCALIEKNGFDDLLAKYAELTK